MTDPEFLAALEACTLPLEGFTHRAHLRLAFLFLRQHGSEAAPDRIVAALQRFVQAHGKEHIYNETLTRVWSRLVASAMDAAPGAASLDALLQAMPHLRDSSLPLRHYRRETLFGDAARATFVPPDLHPLP